MDLSMLKDQKIKKIKQVEMSPEAIDRRLLDLAQLYKLGIAIQNARRLGKVNEIRSLESLENQDKKKGRRLT
jgi:hypothetical protein